MRFGAISVVLLFAAVLMIVSGGTVHAYNTHTVQPGDTLSDIAREHQTDYGSLVEASPDIQDPDLIYPGDEVRINGSGTRTQRSGSASATGATVQRASTGTGQPAPSSGVWERLSQCEAGGDWHINTGNGFYGGLQFLPSTWAAFGGREYAPNAHLATRAQQIEIAKRTQSAQGWGAWPACSAKLGLL